MASFAENFRAAQQKGAAWEPKNMANSYRSDAVAMPTYNGGSTNSLIFRDKLPNDSVGIQELTLQDGNGNIKNLFLMVPKTTNKTAGPITHSEASLAGAFYRAAKEAREKGDEGLAQFADNMMAVGQAIDPVYQVGSAFISPFLNYTRGDRASYIFPDKAAAGGVGDNNSGTGRIYGMIGENGEQMSAEDTQKYLNDLLANKGYSVIAFESPEIKKHYGPDALPGDFLLNVLGRARNAASLDSSFKEAEKHESLQRFLNNLRSIKEGTRNGE